MHERIKSQGSLRFSMDGTLVPIHAGASGSLLLVVFCIVEHGHRGIHCTHLNIWNVAIIVEESYSWNFITTYEWELSSLLPWFMGHIVQYQGTSLLKKTVSRTKSWLQGTKKAVEGFAHPCSSSVYPWVSFRLFARFVLLYWQGKRLFCNTQMNTTRIFIDQGTIC